MEVKEFTGTSRVEYNKFHGEYETYYISAAQELKEYIRDERITPDKIVSISYSRCKTGTNMYGNPEFESSILLVFSR